MNLIIMKFYGEEKKKYIFLILYGYPLIFLSKKNKMFYEVWNFSKEWISCILFP